MIRQIDQRLRRFVGGGVGRAIVGWGEAGTGSAVPAPATADPSGRRPKRRPQRPRRPRERRRVGHLRFVRALVHLTGRQVLPLRGP